MLVRTYFHQMESIESFCLRYDEIIRSVVGGYDIPPPPSSFLPADSRVFASKEIITFDYDGEPAVNSDSLDSSGGTDWTAPPQSPAMLRGFGPVLTNQNAGIYTKSMNLC